MYSKSAGVQSGSPSGIRVEVPVLTEPFEICCVALVDQLTDTVDEHQLMCTELTAVLAREEGFVVAAEAAQVHGEVREHLRELADVVDPAVWDEVGLEELGLGMEMHVLGGELVLGMRVEETHEPGEVLDDVTCLRRQPREEGLLLVVHVCRLADEQLRLPRREKARPRIADDAEHEPAVVGMDVSAFVGGQRAEHRYAIPERTAVDRSLDFAHHLAGTRELLLVLSRQSSEHPLDARAGVLRDRDEQDAFRGQHVGTSAVDHSRIVDERRAGRCARLNGGHLAMLSRPEVLFRTRRSYRKPSQVPLVVRLPHRTKGKPAVSAVERLPAGSRLVHIGPPKTGTTTLQRAMHRQREDMARHGVRYAGPTSRPQEAVFELIIGSARRPDHPMTRWIELVRDVEAAGDMRVCISNEEFAAADDERAARVVHDFGGPSVHVVSAVRRLDKLLPSQWQQRLKRRPGIPPFETWLEIVLSEKSDDPQWVHFWSHHDVRETARRWIAAAGPGHVSFIVLDEADPAFLPSTFEQLLGLRSGLLTDRPQDLNRSLTSEESLLLQKLSAMASERGWSLRQYAELVRPLRMSLQGRPPGAHGRPIVIPTWARVRIEELTLERRDVLLDSGARVIGDIDSIGLSATCR